MNIFRRLRKVAIKTPVDGATSISEAANDALPIWKLRFVTATSTLPALERQLRKEMPWWMNFYEHHAEGFLRLLKDVDDRETLTNLASMHRNGYVREEAVRRIAKRTTSHSDLRWLLLRCADWVPEVQTLAIDAVRRATPSNRQFQEDLTSSVSLIDVNTSNANARELFEELAERLLTKENRERLIAVARHGDFGTSRSAIQLLLRIMEPLDILRFVRADDAKTIRVLATRGLQNLDSCAEVARTIASNKNASLRAEGLWHLIHHDHGLSDQQLEQALADRSSLVRDVAQREFVILGNDLHEFYVNLIITNPLAGLVGLGDCGSNQDIALALRWIQDPSMQTRQAALRVIASFGSTKNESVLVEHAISDSGAASRQAMRGLLRFGINYAVASELWSHMANTNDVAAWRRFYRRLLPSSTRWVALEFALKGCTSPSREIAELGRECVLNILQRVGESHLRPAREQIPTLRFLLAGSKDILPAGAHHELSELLT